MLHQSHGKGGVPAMHDHNKKRHITPHKHLCRYKGSFCSSVVEGYNVHMYAVVPQQCLEGNLVCILHRHPGAPPRVKQQPSTPHSWSTEPEIGKIRKDINLWSVLAYFAHS